MILFAPTVPLLIMVIIDTISLLYQVQSADYWDNCSVCHSSIYADRMLGIAVQGTGLHALSYLLKWLRLCSVCNVLKWAQMCPQIHSNTYVPYMRALYVIAAGLVYLGKSRGYAALNLSSRRHKPFTCTDEIRGSHFIRRTVATTWLRVMCPREHLQKHVPLITRSALAKRTPSLLVALTWQLCQLYGAAVLTNTPGELQLTASCAVKSPRCDLFCNLTGAEESCNEFSIKIPKVRVRAMFMSDKVAVKMNLLYPEDRKRELSCLW